MAGFKVITEEVTRAIMQGRRFSADKAGIVAERVRLFSQLPVESYVRGSGSFGAYVGAKYADDLVVFENVNYGNALYVLYADWEDVSRRSRLDLLRGTNANFDRIVHGPSWEDNFLELIQTELRKRRRSTR
jgi:methyl coenzyme M reductase alpha subunit